jgi:hypothetical protein
MRATTMIYNGFDFFAFEAVPLFSLTFLLSANLILEVYFHFNIWSYKKEWQQ